MPDGLLGKSFLCVFELPWYETPKNVINQKIKNQYKNKNKIK
jgi:hypothetical protein